MRRKLLIFGLSCMIAGGILSIMINMAKAQTDQPPTMQQLCKTDRDAIALDKSLGVNASQITALQNLYNDICGQVN